MRDHELRAGLLKAPKLLWDVLARGRYRFIYDRMNITVQGMSWPKRVNLARSGLNLLHRRLKPWSMPLHMQFEFTTYCNLHCPVCPTGAGTLERPPQAMDPDLFAQVWDEVGPYLLTATLWGWGEALLHPKLGRMLEIAQRHRVATLASTNGMPLERAAVREALVEHPPTTLIVAIDGLTDETNTQFRKGAKLETILGGVRELVELKRKRRSAYPVLQLRYIVMRHNEHEVDRVESFAREHGFELLSLRSISIFDIPNADQVQGRFVPQEPGYQPYRYQDGVRQQRKGFICQTPFWFPSLFVDGTVVVCEQDHSVRRPLGKTSGPGSFRAVWDSPEAAEVRRQVRDEPGTLSFCSNCPFSDRPTADCSLECRQLVPDAGYPGLVAG